MDRQGQILMPPDYRHGGIKIRCCLLQILYGVLRVKALQRNEVTPEKISLYNHGWSVPQVNIKCNHLLRYLTNYNILHL